MHLEGGASLVGRRRRRRFRLLARHPGGSTTSRSRRHELLGHVEAPWLHVHFAERRAGATATAPAGCPLAVDGHDLPEVTRIVFSRNGRDVSAEPSRRGRRDRRGAPDAAAPGARAVERAAGHPARLRWRVLRGGRPCGLAHADRLHAGLLPQDRLRAHLRARDKAEPCRQAGPVPLLPRAHLEHRLLPDGSYRLEVEASDLFGNPGTLELPFTLVKRPLPAGTETTGRQYGRGRE